MRVNRIIVVQTALVAMLPANLFSVRSLAQSYITAIGSPTFATTVPVDAGDINITNGDLQMQFPLASPPQRGGVLTPGEGIVYDSRIWQIAFDGSSYSWQPSNAPSAPAGWRLINAQSSSVGVTNSTSPCDVSPPRAAWRTSSFSFADATGAGHYFSVYTQRQYTKNQNNPCYDPSQPDTTSGDGLALDGSGYHLYVTNYTNAIVYDRNGNQVWPKIEDANGNYFTTDSNNNLVDTRGNTPVVVTISGNTTYYDVLAPGGSRQRVTVVSAPINVSTAFNQPAVSEWVGTLNAVQSITLPGSQGAYQFSYDSYGEVSSVTLPSGGVVNYGYSNYTDSYNNVNRWLTSRTRDGGTWTYTPSIVTQCSAGGTGCVEQVTMTTPGPTSNDTVYQLTLNNGAWNTEIDRYSGSGSGRTLLETNATAYDFSTQCDPNVCIGSEYIRAETNTTTLADVGLSRSETYVYDSPVTGNVTADKIYDYYSGSLPSQPTQETDYVYGYTGTHAQPSPTSITVLKYASGNAATISTTTQGYDESSVVATSSLPNHELLSGTKANLTSVNRWINTTNTYFTTTYTLDDAGVRQTSTDPNGTTSYGYDSTDSFVSTLTPPVPASNVSLASTMQTDPSTGLSLQSTDANGVTQKVPGFDSLNRPTEQDTLDASSNLVGETTYTYYPTAVVTHSYQSSTVYTDSELLLDGYGRASRTAVSNGQSANPWYQQDTCYNASGAVSFVSYPYSGTGFSQAAVCSGSGDSYTYDALARPLTVTHADGSAVSYAYRGRAVQTTDENGVKRIVQIDGLGRQTAVCEVSSNSNMPGSGVPQACGLDYPGSGFLTTYAYDPANYKTTINQGSQIPRVFVTDSLGRQTSLLESEAPYAATTFSYSYNATGLVVSRIRPEANIPTQNALQYTTTTSQYDKLGRILSVTYQNDSLTPNKTFTYDQAGNGGSIPNAGASKGRLTSISNGTHSRSYAYDALGRVTQTVECLPDWCGQPQHDVFRSYTYDWEGNLVNDTYATSGNGQSYSTVTYSYNRANQLISESGGQNNATGAPLIYSVDSLFPYGPQHVTYGNGVSATTQYDGLDRLQGRWLCNGSGGVNCPNGGYLYGIYIQQSGSQVQWAVDTELNRYTQFVYDDMGRLTGSTQPAQNTGYTGLNFSATYDRYGNRWSEAVSNTPSGVGPNLSLTVNTANNQVQGLAYDIAGNMIGDLAGNTYQYDAEGNLVTINYGQTATFAYSTLGERDKVAVGSTVDRYGVDLAGRRSTTWLDGTTSLKEVQYYNDQGPAAFWSASTGSINFEHQDWQGSERVRTDQSGSVNYTTTTLPFGEYSTDSGTDSTPSHYALLDQDVSTQFGISHAAAREYSNQLGRWTSPDPYQGSYDFTNPQSFNRYAYVKNSPVSASDPSGLQEPSDPPPSSGDGCGSVCAVLTLGIGALADLFASLFSSPPSFNGSLQQRPGSFTVQSVDNQPQLGPNGSYTIHVYRFGLSEVVGSSDSGGYYFALAAVPAPALVPNSAQIISNSLSQPRLRTCSQQVFGKPNALNASNAPHIRFVSPSVIGSYVHPGYPGPSDAAGINDPSTNTVFFNNNVFTSALPYVYYLSNYLHEAGNIISFKLFGSELARGGMFVGPNELPVDPDSGASYERCIFQQRMQIP